jgi:hypothetical protein
MAGAYGVPELLSVRLPKINRAMPATTGLVSAL